MGMYEEKVFPVPHFCPLPCFKLVQPEGARHKPPDSGSSVQGPRLCLFLLTEMEVSLPWEEYGSCIDSDLSY